MNVHDLKDLESIARTLRHHYGATLVLKDPDTNKAVNIVLLIESVVDHCRMDARDREVPRRETRKAYLPRREYVQVKSSRPPQEQVE